MLKIYDSMRREKSAFVPLQENKVAMYVCGITVYDYCHVGHARLLATFDLIYRHLQHLGFDVTYVRNITDVDDKIFARARENGENYKALSERFIGFMHEDEASLNILPPGKEPRATGYMQEIINLIRRLEEKGCAYQGSNGDVYFAIDKFAEYGKLSKRKVEDLLVGHRIEAEKAKNNPLDFVLWKMAKAGEASWPSPWGEGRPGWHIECSAMSTSTLGDTLDIHGGGSDLIFPHHENEIAQSEAATGHVFANYWMHCGSVRVNEEKMSKSLNNFFTIREVLKEYHPEVLRFFLSSSHYRSPINYSEDNLQLARREVDKFYRLFEKFDFCYEDSKSSEQYKFNAFRTYFNEAMDDDFNTPRAIAVMFNAHKQVMSEMDEQAKPQLMRLIVEFGRRLGFLYLNYHDYFQSALASESNGLSPHEIEKLISERNEARAQKDWARADKVRATLDSAGIILEDSNGKTTWKRK